MVNAYIAVLEKYKHYVIYCIIFCSIFKQKERRSKPKKKHCGIWGLLLKGTKTESVTQVIVVQEGLLTACSRPL